MTHERAADVSVVLSWGFWFFAHIVEINQVLQFIALICAVIASIFAILYHRKRLNDDRD